MATRRRRSLRRNDGGVLDEANATLALVKASLRAPFVNARVSTLGGEHRPSVMLTVSLDPPDSWINGILQNSRYAQFSINWPERSIEHFSGYGTPKFRKARFKTPEEVLLKLQRWADSAPPVANSKREPSLSRIVEDTYGVNALRAEPIVLEWAFDRLSKQVGLPEARAQLQALNSRRKKLGARAASVVFNGRKRASRPRRNGESRRVTFDRVPFIISEYSRGRWSIWYAASGGTGVPDDVGPRMPRRGWPSYEEAEAAAREIARHPHSARKRLPEPNRRTSRRAKKRTSRGRR